MPNKLTDNEITIKALKELLEVMLCEGDLQRSATISHAIDLINRLQVRVEKSEKVEHFADKTIATLQAENERLKKWNDVHCSMIKDLRENVCKLSELLETAKAEARKEFAERLCEDRVSNDPVVIATQCLLIGMESENNVD